MAKLIEKCCITNVLDSREDDIYFEENEKDDPVVDDILDNETIYYADNIGLPNSLITSFLIAVTIFLIVLIIIYFQINK